MIWHGSFWTVSRRTRNLYPSAVKLSKAQLGQRYFSRLEKNAINQSKLLDRPLFLDNQATTPIDPRVFEEMVPYMSRDFGNPHSTAHIYGTSMMKVWDTARQRVAASIKAKPEDIIFMSGATEANNTAIKGIARGLKNTRNHIVTLNTEHKWVLESCYELQKEGFDITVLPVKRNGLVDLDQLKQCITDKTCLVSIMTVNNEIGVVQPIKQIGELWKEKGAAFHTDAAQAMAKIEIDVDDMNIDLLSMTGHKFYGPKGIGALFIRDKFKNKLKPLISGGGQEKGIRSGTLTPFLLAGLGKSCELSITEYENDKQWVTSLSSQFFNTISKNVKGITLNGDKDQRYKGNVNISIKNVPSARLIAECKEVSMSSGAAWLVDDPKEGPEPSYVIKALGLEKELGLCCIRFSFGRFTTLDEVDLACNYLTKAINKIRDS